MWNLNLSFQRLKGFSLIELILWLALFSVLMTASISLLINVNGLINRGHNQDTMLLTGQYALDYIKKEILGADRIIPSSKITNLDRIYPNNIGFVILNIKAEDNEFTGKKIYTYNYSTYYLKNDQLIRIATNRNDPNYPPAKEFSGYNQLCKGVAKLWKTRLDMVNKMIHLNLTISVANAQEQNFKSTIKLNCPIDY